MFLNKCNKTYTKLNKNTAHVFLYDRSLRYQRVKCKRHKPILNNPYYQ